MRAIAAGALAALVAVLVVVPGDGSGRARLAGPGGPPAVWPVAAPACVVGIVSGMSPEEQAGQLLMVGVDVARPEPADDVVSLLVEHHVGSVYLRGRSDAGVTATRRLTEAVRSAAEAGGGPGDRPSGGPGVGLTVAVDQEGGLVQVLRGPGFTDLPTAQEQGALPDGELRLLASRLGGELVAAGISMNLAPVADVTPPGRANAPVGDLERHYSPDPAAAAAAVGAVTEELLAQGVAPVLKHYPGLGRADGNTDVDPDVRDLVTVPGDASAEPFRAGTAAGAPVVMMSSAAYPNYDDQALAVFSPEVVATLREDVGFDGVVMTDDLDRADGVAGIPVGVRAVAAVRAGVDLVLVYGAGAARTMIRALVEAAHRDERFAARLSEAATRVVRHKAEAGLVASCPGGLSR